jgi:hypothetical protein
MDTLEVHHILVSPRGFVVTINPTAIDLDTYLETKVIPISEANEEQRWVAQEVAKRMNRVYATFEQAALYVEGNLQ